MGQGSGAPVGQSQFQGMPEAPASSQMSQQNAQTPSMNPPASTPHAPPAMPQAMNSNGRTPYQNMQGGVNQMRQQMQDMSDQHRSNSQAAIQQMHAGGGPRSIYAPSPGGAAPSFGAPKSPSQMFPGSGPKPGGFMQSGGGMKPPMSQMGGGGNQMKLGTYSRKEMNMEITKEAAVRQMSIYLSHLANRVPLHSPQTKIAAMSKIAELAAALNQTQDLSMAINQVYPEKNTGDQVKLAVQLIRGLAKKRASAIKRALGSSTTPLGVTSHCSGALSGPTGGVTSPMSTTVKMGSHTPNPFA